MPKFLRKNHCSGDNWTSQGTATGLVDASDARDTGSTQLPFMTESTAPIHRCADYTDEEKRKLGKQENKIEDSALSPLIPNRLSLVTTLLPPSLPCLCGSGGNSTWRGERGLAVPLRFSRSAASAMGKRARHLRRRKFDGL